jgi:hypothetical protein
LSGNASQWASPLLVLLFFAVLWIGVTSLVLRLSGWLALERSYRASGGAKGIPVRLRAAKLGRGFIGQFRNVLTLWVGKEGLQLHVLVLFGPNRSDLFFPWADISVSRGRQYFSEYVELTFARAPAIRLRIYGHAAVMVRNAAGSDWPVGNGSSSCN